MRVKIIPQCSEKMLNQILQQLEDEQNREIEDVRIVGDKIWIFHYPDRSDEFKDEIASIRKNMEKLREEYLK